MKLLQVTDTHVGGPGHTAFGIDPRTRLEACVADINAHHADAALCMVTGDLVNEGSVEEYANIAPVLRTLKMPFRVLTGNHDERQAMRRFFPDVPVDAHGFYQSTFEVPGGKVLLLDTLHPGHPSGVMCAQRLEWLSAQLAAAGDAVYIAMHHPPMALGIEYLDGMALSNPEDFWAILAPHRERIRLIVFGHVHRPVSGMYRGVAFAGCPSTAHQVALELGPQAESHLSYNREPPCYAILDISAEGCIVHQQRYTENWNLIRKSARRVTPAPSA